MRSILKERGTVYCGNDSWTTISNTINKNNYTSIFIIADRHTVKHCVPLALSKLSLNIAPQIITIPAGEEHKNITTCTMVWQQLIDFGADRKSLIINIGGGVTTDLGGFIAATYMRGIECINIPTSLLAMVDAAVGGKNGIDFSTLKNLIGVIKDPLFVLIDTAFLKTLPKDEINSGYAEMLKHGIIYQKIYWNQLKSFSITDITAAENLIWESILFKNKVVAQDLLEKKERKTLNYGHTLGHAIESYCLDSNNRAKLLHGHAIAIGMILATYISFKKCGLNETILKEISSTINHHYQKEFFSATEIENIKSLLKHDKKNTSGIVNFVLIADYGKAMLNQQVSDSLINEAFAYYHNL